MAQILCSIPQACEALAISRATLYELISAGKIATVHIGRRSLIPAVELERYAAALVSVGERDA